MSLGILTEKQVASRVTLVAAATILEGQGVAVDGTLWDGSKTLAGVAENDAAAGDTVTIIKGFVPVLFYAVPAAAVPAYLIPNGSHAGYFDTAAELDANTTTGKEIHEYGSAISKIAGLKHLAYVR